MDGTYKNRILELANAEPDIPFLQREYAARLDLVRAAMADAGIDLLYVSAPESLNYLTGFKSLWYQAHGHSGWGPSSGLAINRSDQRPVLFETEKERLLVGHTTTGVDFSLLPRYSKPLMEFVLDGLQERGFLEGTVGLEMGSYRPFSFLSHAFQERLESHGCRVADGTAVVAGVRQVKSPPELALIVQAARIADCAIEAGAQAARAGVSELELYGVMYRAMMRAGGDAPAMPPQVLSGVRTVHARGLPSERTLVLGDVVVLSAFGCVDRYHALVTRTLVLGEPAEALSAWAHDAVAGTRDMLERIQTGDSPRRIVEHGRTALSESGAWEARWQAFGHELGIALPPDAMSGRFFSFEDVSDAGPVGSGEALALSAGFRLPGGSGVMRVADTLIFTNDGVRPVSALPLDLTVLD